MTAAEVPVEDAFEAAVAQRLGEAAVQWNSSGNSTARGSGDHQSTGWPGEYQGKMPRR